MREGTNSREEGDIRGKIAQGGGEWSNTGRDRMTGEHRDARERAATASKATS